MRLGKIVIDFGYVVDLDNEKMVEEAQKALVANIMDMCKYEELYEDFLSNIDIVEGKDLSEEDIPEFLLEEVEEDA